MVQYTLIEHTECTDVLNVIIAIATVYSVIKSQPECDVNESTYSSWNSMETILFWSTEPCAALSGNDCTFHFLLHLYTLQCLAMA